MSESVTRIRIDLNVRVGRGLTFSSFDDVEPTGPRGLRPGDAVEVYEGESGLRGPARVTELDLARRLVYLEVPWAQLRPGEPDTDVAAEALELPAEVRSAAEAIEASLMFRANFTPAHPLGRLHPAAAEFARLAIAAARREDPA